MGWIDAGVDYACGREVTSPLTYAGFSSGGSSFTYGVGWTIVGEQLLASSIVLVSTAAHISQGATH